VSLSEQWQALAVSNRVSRSCVDVSSEKLEQPAVSHPRGSRFFLPVFMFRYVYSAQWATHKLLLALLVLTVSWLSSAATAAAGKSSTPNYQGRCTRVVDGDSLYLASLKTQIRLWGVDAPERNEAGYQTAKDQLKALALQKELNCEQVDIDKYGRIVARCVVTAATGKTEINRAMIASGAAKEYCYFSRGYYGHCK
jgi:endonuclease YncB( thermonuclease family)